MPDSVTREVEKTTRHDCHLGPGFDMFNMEVHLHKLLLRLQLPTSPPNDRNAGGADGSNAGALSEGFVEVVETGEEAEFFYVPVYPNLFMCAMAARQNRTYDKQDYALALDIGTGSSLTCSLFILFPSWRVLIAFSLFLFFGVAYKFVKEKEFWSKKGGSDHIFAVTHGWGVIIF